MNTSTFYTPKQLLSKLSYAQCFCIMLCRDAMGGGCWTPKNLMGIKLPAGQFQNCPTKPNPKYLLNYAFHQFGKIVEKAPKPPNLANPLFLRKIRINRFTKLGGGGGGVGVQIWWANWEVIRIRRYPIMQVTADSSPTVALLLGLVMSAACNVLASFVPAASTGCLLRLLRWLACP